MEIPEHHAFFQRSYPLLPFIYSTKRNSYSQLLQYVVFVKTYNSFTKIPLIKKHPNKNKNNNNSNNNQETTKDVFHTKEHQPQAAVWVFIGQAVIGWQIYWPHTWCTGRVAWPVSLCFPSLMAPLVRSLRSLIWECTRLFQTGLVGLMVFTGAILYGPWPASVYGACFFQAGVRTKKPNKKKNFF